MEQEQSVNDDLFIKVAVGGGFLDDDQIDQAKMLQKIVLKRSGQRIALGKILVTLGTIDKKELETILRMQKAMQADLEAGPKKKQQGPGENTEHQEPEPDFVLTIAKDHMQAQIKVPPGNPGKISLERVKKELATNGIVFGLIDDAEIKNYLENGPQQFPLEVARGKEPMAGRPMEIVYHFDTDPLRVGTLKEDGTMDWKDRGSLPQVKPGDLLAEKVTSDPGRPGTDILGQTVAPPKIKEIIIRCGRGVERSADGKKAFAKIGGSPRIGPDGKINVMATYVINGDLGLETGHVDFSGHIDVQGIVQSGFKVQGHGLRAKEIQAAEIKLDGDLICLGGIYGARIEIEGKLRASHVHDSRILAVGDVVVEREIFDSDIETGGRCVIGGGNIIASMVSAKKGIQAMDVGTEAARPSRLTVGIDEILNRKVAQLKKRLAQIEKKRLALQTEIESLTEKYDESSTELGEVALEQDRCMVEKRQLEEKAEAEQKAGRPVEEETITRIEKLQQCFEQHDARVAALMEEEDLLKAQISTRTQTLGELEVETGHIQNRISTLAEDSRQDRAVPIIKVSGTIYSKTEVQGPHTSLILPEDRQHVRIAEVKEGGSGKMAIYTLKITPLR